MICVVSKRNKQLTVSDVRAKENNCGPVRKLTGGSLGVAVGAIPTYLVIKDAFSKVSDSDSKMLGNLMTRLMPDIDTFSKTKTNADEILKTSGLNDKGAKLFITNKESANELTQILEEAVPKSFPCREKYITHVTDVFTTGLNAAYMEKKNLILINDKNLYSSVYHEIGHALNANNSFIFKNLQKLRGILTPFGAPILGLGFLAVGIFHKNKPQKENNSSDSKTMDFVKNNAGKLTFATCLPMLIEEGAASIKGLKEAKPYLDAVQYKNLSKNYKRAFGSYFVTTAVLSGAIALGILIKDKITKSNQTKS